MKNTIKDMKNYIILILIAVFSYWGLNNLTLLGNILKTIYNVLLPFILGGVIAFILNIPAKKIEDFLLKHNKKKQNKGLIRAISIIISLLIFLLIISFIAFLLIPELVENIELLLSNIPNLVSDIQKFILKLLDKYPDIQTEIEDLFSTSGNVTNIVSNILNYLINGAVGFISSLVSSFVTLFTAIIFSIYMLSQKEYLVRGTKKIMYATMNNEKVNKLIEIGSLANKTFSKFISGQCVEAIILGLIIFFVSIICRFPYALIIAVLTTVTALIPIFGALIAMIIGAILIGITSPIQALIFIIAFQVVQQIEGNFIYPKVVGKSVGLSPMWTLLAITVGGNLFGIPGMLIGLPLASIVYALAKELVNNKLNQKQIKIS